MVPKGKIIFMKVTLPIYISLISIFIPVIFTSCTDTVEVEIIHKSREKITIYSTYLQSNLNIVLKIVGILRNIILKGNGL